MKRRFGAVILTGALLLAAAGCGGGTPSSPARADSATVAAFATNHLIFVPVECICEPPDLYRISADLQTVTRAARQAQGISTAAVYATEGSPPRVVLWYEDSYGDRDYFFFHSADTGGEGWAGTWYLDTLSCTLDSGDWRTAENLFPLHLMPQSAFFERDGAALKLKAGSRVELSPVTLEDGGVVDDLYPLFVEFYERSGLYEVTEEGEGVFTARLTCQTDSTQPTLRFTFRADDSGHSVTVDFA